MQQSAVPVLLLALAALSSCYVLPASTFALPHNPTPHTQLNDNIFTHRFFNSDTLKNIFCKELLGTSYKQPKMCRSMQTRYDEADNKDVDILTNVFHKGEKYNEEGFRKEQWHNYPRQLDRLHRYLYRQYTSDANETPDPHDPYIDNQNLPMLKESFQDLTTNGRYGDTAVDPLLVLKIHLAELKNDLKSKRDVYPDVLSQPEYVHDDLGSEDNGLETLDEMNQSDLRSQLNNDVEETGISVKKRLFSLWSRLQSLAPRGHELHHRRYLHAIYGMQDGDKSALTAETRATLMRPPGSPLRWG